MMSRLFFLATLALLVGLGLRADEPTSTGTLQLAVVEKELVTLEPILVTLRLEGRAFEPGLPPGPGKIQEAALRFEIQPAVKPRSGAKPLPIEADRSPVHLRMYDLLEWYQFPAEGAWTVQAVLEAKGVRATSEPVKLTIRRPAKTDAEWGPVDRIHHIPWSNYVTDAFCGDCFDVVKRWPDSRLAKYCHYWNGLHHQHKKEYDKAIASFRTVTEKQPRWLLADHAHVGIDQCLHALNRAPEADKLRREARLNFSGTPGAPKLPTFSAADHWQSLPRQPRP